MNPTVVFVRQKEIILEDRERPVPKNGELLIKTRCTLISTGTELTILSGEFLPGSEWDTYGQFPFLPGYDNIGQVIDAGPNVDKKWIGRKVATYGRHALYVVDTVQNARLIHRDIPDEHAVFFTISEIVMNSVRRARVGWGESVVIYGLGLLGQLAVRYCRMCGAKPVIAVDIADSRLQRLPDEASIIPVNPKQEDIVSIVEKVTKGRKSDIVFEVTGNAQLIPDELKVLRKQGRFILLSSPPGKTLFDFHDFCNAPSFTIIGTHNASHPEHETPNNPWTKQRHAEFFFELVADGELDLTPLISHRESYNNACRLYQMLLQDRSKVMGIVMDWTK